MKVLVGSASVKGRTLSLSKAARVGSFIFTSGHLPVRSDGALEDGTIEEQTRCVLRDLEATLEEVGASLADVVKTTVWLADAADFAGFNEAYGEFFKVAPPARSTVVSALVVNARVEIEAVAYVGSPVEM